MRKPPVVVLSGIRWDFLWQRHQTLATLFAGAGYPTVFVETTGLANPRLTGDSLRRVLGRIRRPGARERRSLRERPHRLRAARRPADLRAFRWSNTEAPPPAHHP